MHGFFQLIVLRVFFPVNIRHPPKYKKKPAVSRHNRSTGAVLEYWRHWSGSGSTIEQMVIVQQIQTQ